MAWRENATFGSVNVLKQLNLYGSVFPNPYGAQDYFVDGNAVTSGNGKGWGGAGNTNTPMNTLSEAITASNLTIVAAGNRWWARRNRIFCCGDQELTENLTIFPEKCDIIGVGFDVEAMPRITGDHTIAAVATGKARSTRWINCGFMAGSTGETFHLTTDHMGIEFHGCKFWPLVTGSTHAIRLADDNRGFKFIDSDIYEHAGAPGTGIYAEGIKVEGNGQHDMVFRGGSIYATEGIHIVAATGGYNSICRDMIVRAVAITINDAASLLVIADTSLISDADANTITAGAVVNANLCNRVFLTHSGSEEGEWIPQPQTD